MAATNAGAQEEARSVAPRIDAALPPGAVARFDQLDGGPWLSIHRVAFSPDGRMLVAADRLQKTVLWELRGGILRHEFRAHRGGTGDLCFSPDGRTLASAGNDARVTVRDIRDGAVVGELKTPHLPLESVAFSPDGRILAAGCRDRHVYFWDVASGEHLGTSGDLDGWGLAVGFLNQGRELAALSNGGLRTVQILHVPTGQVATPLPRFTDPDNRIRAMAISGDGRLLAVGGEDHVVSVYDLPRRVLVMQLQGHTNTVNGLAFSPDGQLLYSVGADQMTRVWETATAAPVLAIGGHQHTTRGISSVAASADGRRFATGGHDAQVLVWDLGLLLSQGLGGPWSTWVQSNVWDEDGMFIPWNWDQDMPEPSPPPEDLAAPKSLESCWAGLAAQSGDEGQRSVWLMVSLGDEATRFLARHLHPIQGGADLDLDIERWIHELGHDEFDVRQRASESLENVLDRAIDRLAEARYSSASEEVRVRAQILLNGRETFRVQTDEVRRTGRAIQVLEHLGSPAARTLLKRLAGGTPDARQTREARGALARVEARLAYPPIDRMSSQPGHP